MIINIILSLLSGILYRAGGMGKEYDAKPTWIPEKLRNTKVRDLGIPFVGVLVMVLMHGLHWIYPLCFLAVFGAQTTYLKKKGQNAKWFNWFLVGLLFSIAWIPFTIVTHNWLGFLYRTIIVTVFTTLWSEFNDDVFVEEFGRGFIQTATLFLL